MKALGLIIQREYFSRIKKKSFIVLTLLIPFLIAGVVFVPLMLSSVKDSEVKRIIVIDNTRLYAQHLQSSETYNFETTEKTPDEMRSNNGEIFGLLQITEDLSANPQAVSFYSEKQAPHDLLKYMNSVLNEVSKNKQLEDFTQSVDIDPIYIQSIQKILESKGNISISTIRWSKDGEDKETSTELASTIGMTCTLLMYMFILTYGAMVMQGVIEEKTNRIVEVMISSVRPFDLMMGKIIGIGLTGFTQLLIWIMMGIGFLTLKTAILADQASEIQMYLNLLSTIDWGNILGFFILFFIGGYLIYAAIFAMFASAVDNAQDSQQFVMPVTMIFIFALYAGMYSLKNPDGPLAFWCSMIPFTSPIVMMVRVPAGIPMWEILVSLAILFISVLLVTKLAAKIYRVGILMYGKKPSLQELYKWAKYK